MTDSQEPVVGHSDGQLAAVGGHGGGEVPLVAADLDQGRTGALPQQGSRFTVALRFYMLPNRSVCANSSLFDSFQPVLFGQCYGVNREETDFLGRGKAAALCRLMLTVFWTIAYTMMYDVIVDPLSSL